MVPKPLEVNAELQQPTSYSILASVVGTFWLAGVSSPLTPRPCLSKESNWEPWTE